MKTNLMLGTLLLSAALITGCHKPAAPRATATRPMPQITADSANTTTAEAAPAPTGTEIASTGQLVAKDRDYGTDGHPNLENLSEALREWTDVAANGFPKSMEELVASKYFSRLPKPPAGQRYLINTSAGRLELTRY